MAVIRVFQLSHSLLTTSQIHLGNPWTSMIFFRQPWSTESWALRTSIQATLRLRLCLWQSSVTIRSTIKLSVVPLHPAFAPRWWSSIRSFASRCLSIDPKTHEVNDYYYYYYYHYYLFFVVRKQGFHGPWVHVFVLALVSKLIL